MNASNSVIFTKHLGSSGDVGKILLNRPKALNALSYEMILAISEQLTKWAVDTSIKAVIIKGEGERAFCAGGDVRAIYDRRDISTEDMCRFFWAEYTLDAQIYHFPKPYISFLDGITMGGGAGVSIHGSHRVATENLIFAMPETGIGFFPDIGAGYFLSRCPDKTGIYLGLTGNSINAADTYHLGLATHVVTADQLNELENNLINTKFNDNPHQTVSNVIKQVHRDPNKSTFSLQSNKIKKYFSFSTIEEIIQELSKGSDEFSKSNLQTLQTRSPTSLKVTLAHLQRSSAMHFDEVIKSDYDIVQHFLKGHDFYEGVRAALIDKDHKPKWLPPNLAAVGNDTVEKYFEPIGERLILPPNF